MLPYRGRLLCFHDIVVGCGLSFLIYYDSLTSRVPKNNRVVCFVSSLILSSHTHFVFLCGNRTCTHTTLLIRVLVVQTTNKRDEKIKDMILRFWIHFNTLNFNTFAATLSLLVLFIIRKCFFLNSINTFHTCCQE